MLPSGLRTTVTSASTRYDGPLEEALARAGRWCCGWPTRWTPAAATCSPRPATAARCCRSSTADAVLARRGAAATRAGGLLSAQAHHPHGRRRCSGGSTHVLDVAQRRPAAGHAGSASTTSPGSSCGRRSRSRSTTTCRTARPGAFILVDEADGCDRRRRHGGAAAVVTAPRRREPSLRTVPAGLDRAGAASWSVGGGTVATRRAAALVEAGADVHVVAPADRARSSPRLRVTAAPAPYRSGDLAGAWLVHAATDVARGQRARRRRRRARPRLVRARGRRLAVDGPHPGGGAFGRRHGGGDRRRGPAARSRALAAAVRARAGRRRAARAPATAGRAGRVTLVGGGPGDPGLITVRGLRALVEADVVVVDRLAPRELLARLDPAVEVVDAGKAPHAHNLTQAQINELRRGPRAGRAARRAAEGRRPVRVRPRRRGGARLRAGGRAGGRRAGDHQRGRGARGRRASP